MLRLNFDRKRSLKKQLDNLQTQVNDLEEKIWDLESYLDISHGYTKRGEDD